MKLSDLTQILGDAAAAPERAQMQEITERIKFFFHDPDPDDDDETLELRYLHIKIGDKKIRYPLLLMGSLTPINTKKTRFKLATDLDLSGHEDKEGKPEIEISLKKGLFKNASHIEIEGEFEGAAQPEAFSQLQDKYNDLIADALAKIHFDMEKIEETIDETEDTA